MLEPQCIRVVLSFISLLRSEKEAGGREEAGKGEGQASVEKHAAGQQEAVRIEPSHHDIIQSLLFDLERPMLRKWEVDRMSEVF